MAGGGSVRRGVPDQEGRTEGAGGGRGKQVYLPAICPISRFPGFSDTGV